LVKRKKDDEDIKLHLKIKDNKDLEVISALLQDAIVPVLGIIFSPKKKAFSLILQRFRWEKTQETETKNFVFERTYCHLYFDHVEKVQRKGFQAFPINHHLNFLSLQLDKKDILLLFSGGNTIKIKIGNISGYLTDHEDLGWPTFSLPSHE
jgi:hypothetical protein